MCDICYKNPCSPRCPNAEKSKANTRCIHCGDGIFPDDRYISAPEGPICEHCLDESSIFDIITSLGYSLETKYA